RPCYAYLILLGGDDVSGNRSKVWNKHWCFYFCAAGLPLACLNQEYFVHFVSTSQHAGPVEQVAAITAALRYDFASGDGFGECLTIPSLFVETGDGPWQSELSSHSGDSKPCRFCDVGGTVKERSSDTGFLAIMQGAAIERNQRESGVVDTLAQTVIEELVQKGKALYDEKDPAGKRVLSNAEIEHKLEFKVFDPHLDTAVGRLHLVLLGFTKYFWSASLPVGGGKKLSAKDKETLHAAEATLFSLSQNGIGERSLRPDYIMHFRGSLVGRHLHGIAQLAVFLFARIVDPVLHAVWVSLSRLCALLFVQTIYDMVKYKARLDQAIQSFYDAVCTYNPTWIMYKNKFHYLAHTPAMIERFGPLGLVAEDRFEKFHGLWRNSSIFSNHHSASRD
ncbi:hypothetical protein BC628DRAFT_1304362, partial [Trametes gibbosa]